MVIASCIYSTEHLESRWINVQFTECVIDCQAINTTHEITQDRYELPTAEHVDTLTLVGQCGDEVKPMIKAECTNKRWRVTQLKCVLHCEANVFHHPLVIGSLPESQIETGTSYSHEFTCDGEPKVILSADCVLSPDGSAYWVNEESDDCIVKCETQSFGNLQTFTVSEGELGDDYKFHGLCGGVQTLLAEAECVGSLAIGATWNLTEYDCELSCSEMSFRASTSEIIELDTTPLGDKVIYNGMCDGERVPVLEADCTGNRTHGAFWDVRQMPCEVNCEGKSFTNLDTEETVSLPRTPIFSESTLQFSCGGEVTEITASCVGNKTHGAQWNIPEIPLCNPSCSATTVLHQITGDTFTLAQTAFGENQTLKGQCGGEEHPLVYGECVGDRVRGVVWTINQLNCTPSCKEQSFYHSDINKTITIPTTQHGSGYQARSLCDGKQDVLLQAECGGEITTKPIWMNVHPTKCAGTCDETRHVLPDSNEEATLPKTKIGETVEIVKQCAGLNHTELIGQCKGNNADGGKWELQHEK